MFYTYIQNNSGGYFKITKKIKHYVIIEADSAKEANEKAEHIGIYFEGVKKDRDCPCCGDRWHKVLEKGGTKKPKIYGDNVLSYFAFRRKLFYWYPLKKKAIVYYKDGKFEVFSEKENNKL